MLPTAAAAHVHRFASTSSGDETGDDADDEASVEVEVDSGTGTGSSPDERERWSWSWRDAGGARPRRVLALALGSSQPIPNSPLSPAAAAAAVLAAAASNRDEFPRGPVRMGPGSSRKRVSRTSLTRMLGGGSAFDEPALASSVSTNASVSSPSFTPMASAAGGSTSTPTSSATAGWKRAILDTTPPSSPHALALVIDPRSAPGDDDVMHTGLSPRLGAMWSTASQFQRPDAPSPLSLTEPTAAASASEPLVYFLEDDGVETIVSAGDDAGGDARTEAVRQLAHAICARVDRAAIEAGRTTASPEVAVWKRKAVRTAALLESDVLHRVASRDPTSLEYQELCRDAALRIATSPEDSLREWLVSSS